MPEPNDYDPFVVSRNILVDPDNPNPSPEQAMFNSLVCDWEESAFFHSNFNVIFEHKSFQKIVGMGEAALPFIFKSLTQEHIFLFVAARLITRENAARDAPPGNIKKMCEPWIEWGKQHGYC